MMGTIVTVGKQRVNEGLVKSSDSAAESIATSNLFQTD